jgi:hypothetical protein
MITQEDIDTMMGDYNANEIETRLNAIFNGYLGCDTGDSPDEIQQNHHVVLSIINVFRRWQS